MHAAIAENNDYFICGTTANSLLNENNGLLIKLNKQGVLFGTVTFFRLPLLPA